MDISIESFINFMDEYDNDTDIAIEGIGQKIKEIGKSIWATMKRILAKIITWFKNILLNINYFKTAKLDEKMNQDLMYCLKLAQPRTENYQFKVVPTMFSSARLYVQMSRKDSSGEGTIDGAPFGVAAGNALARLTTFKEQLFNAKNDVHETIDNVKKCEAYKRLTGDYKYENKNIKDIPLGNIISDMKKANTNITKFNGEVEKAESISMKMKNKYPKFSALSNSVASFFQSCVTFYSMRSQILMKYFNAAKASIGSIGSNIKEKVNKNNDPRNKTKHAGAKFVIMRNDVANKVKKLTRDANNAKTFKEYKPIHDEITRILKIPSTATLYGVQAVGGKQVYLWVNQKKNEVTIDKNMRLYHTSNNDNITELEPRWKAGGGALFATPRVYFHISTPLNRYGNKVGSYDTVYTPRSLPSKAVVDPEMGRTAVYVETERPIPVEKIDYDKWRSEAKEHIKEEEAKEKNQRNNSNTK